MPVCIWICKYMIVYLWVIMQVCVCAFKYMYVHVHSASSEWETQAVRWHLWRCCDVCGGSGEGK